MTPIKYIYVDDDRFETVKMYIKTLEDHAHNTFCITHIQVMEIIEIVNKIRDEKFQGVIIDQQLTAESVDNKKVDFYGTTLAQHLRTVMAVKEIPSMPLILLSNENRIVESFTPDESSQDLFDFVIKKNKLSEISIAKHASDTLIELIEAYNIANTINLERELSEDDIMHLLNITNSDFRHVDKRFLDYLQSKSNDPHAIISAIYSTLIRSAGMLVTERMLLTKLGIDKDSSPDWIKLKEIFSNFQYRGIFSKKERWWFGLIEDWWYAEFPENSIIQALDANERVALLIKKFDFTELKALTATYPGDQSLNFWVNCICTGVPLDPFDALRARAPDLKPWEQPKYLDLLAVLNGLNDNYPIHIEDRGKRDILLARLKPHV